MSPRIEINFSSLESSGSGSVTGVIGVDFNGHIFPREGWNDFVVVVMSWFGAAIYELITKSSESQCVDFMEGPYCIKIEISDKKDFTLYAVDQSHRDSVLCIEEVSSLGFASHFIDLGYHLISECNKKNWRSSDVDNLKSCCEKIKAKLQKHLNS
jgi:hypothetical protein